MSLERKQVSVRLSDEAMRVLKLLCDIEDKDYGEKAREVLERALLGEGHAATLHAERLARALSNANLRESALKPVKGRAA